jgi:hypothetical protein
MSQQINLFNPVFLKQKKHFSAKTMVQGLALVTLGVLLFYGVVAYELVGMRAQETITKSRAAQTSQQLGQAAGEAVKRPSKLLEDEVHRAESALKTVQDMLGSLDGELTGSTAGFSTYLAALARQPVSGLWLTGFSIAGDELELRGRALRPELLPVFIRRLNNEDVLRGKRFSELSLAAKQEPARGSTPLPVGAKPAPPQNVVEFSLGTRQSEKAGAPR